MANRVVMPKLTDTMEEGVLLQWYKKEGDSVESGDAIAEIETDKAVMDLEAFASGTLKKILVPPGHIVPSGDLIALIARDDEDIEAILAKETMPRIRKQGEDASPSTQDKPRATETTHQTQPEVTPEEITTPPAEPSIVSSPPTLLTDGKIKASPLARKIATERQIDLRQVKGSGPGGRIIQRDLESLAPTSSLLADQAASQSEAECVELSMLRKAIASRMLQSKGPVPHFYVTSEIDMGQVMPFREALGKNRGRDTVKPSLSDLFLKGTALTLRKFPAFRSSYAGDHLKISNAVDIGLAIGLPEGVITAVIRNCDQKTLSQISAEVKNKVARARVKKLKPEEYTGAVFSISNLGMYDVESFSAIITPPEAAVLAIGSIIEKPVVSKGEIVIGQIVKVTLSTDHRVADGLQAAEFLKTLKQTMENPLSLAM